MRLAIITGASSGLGREFAVQIEKRYHSEIDEMWLIARHAEDLNELADALNACGHIKAVAVPMDLTDKESLEALSARLEACDACVSYLVNAAGFGKIGGPFTLEREDLLKMIDLNCRAAVDITAMCIPHLRAKSHVLEICSSAAFQPMQGMNVYAASKSFLLRYTQALRWELIGKNIRLTAVCPYWVRGTKFIETARDTGYEKTERHVRHMFLATSTPAGTVRWALLANRAGKWVSTPGILCTAIRYVSMFTPPWFMMGWWEIFRRA